MPGCVRPRRPQNGKPRRVQHGARGGCPAGSPSRPRGRTCAPTSRAPSIGRRRHRRRCSDAAIWMAMLPLSTGLSAHRRSLVGKPIQPCVRTPRRLGCLDYQLVAGARQLAAAASATPCRARLQSPVTASSPWPAACGSRTGPSGATARARAATALGCRLRPPAVGLRMGPGESSKGES